MKAEKGDLIRVTHAADYYYKVGGIYEVKRRGTKDNGVFIETNHYEAFVADNEYVIHRKAGEEDEAETPCEKCASFVGTEKQGSFCSRECIERYQRRISDLADEIREPFRKYRDEQSVSIQDAVNPQHYKQGRVEVIDIIEDAVRGADPFEAVCHANIIKYSLRYRHKNGVEDLRKSVWYTEKLIAYLDAKSTQTTE